MTDRAVVEHFMEKYLPYSDFNFDSLWSYNTNNTVLISLLNNNLVVQFQDYITTEPFLSFIGTTNITATVQLLLQYCVSHNLQPRLRLVPEIALYQSREKLREEYTITEDIDDFDYIYLTDDLIELKGRDYRAKRNFVNRFKKNYPQHSYVLLDLTDVQVQNTIINLFLTWEKNKKVDRSDSANELNAIKRVMKLSDSPQLITIGVYIGKEIVAFSINEVSFHQFGVIHFEKANTLYKGSYQYLKNITAIELKKAGCIYINYEQDLGIKNLRKAKRSWKPIGYLKKYEITPRQGNYAHISR